MKGQKKERRKAMKGRKKRTITAKPMTIHILVLKDLNDAQFRNSKMNDAEPAHFRQQSNPRHLTFSPIAGVAVKEHTCKVRN